MSLHDESTSPINTLPPIICANQREKVLAEQIPFLEIVKVPKEKLQRKDVSLPLTPLEKPFPSHPLWISWSPDELVFEIDDEPIVQRIWVWNRSFRSIYVHCCDIWDEIAYSGSKWCCYPQTRFLLAPGMMGEMFVRASPKELAPVPCAFGKLQLAAAHMRDRVTGFFAVPINVKFLKHVPYVGEGG